MIVPNPKSCKLPLNAVACQVVEGKILVMEFCCVTGHKGGESVSKVSNLISIPVAVYGKNTISVLVVLILHQWVMNELREVITRGNLKIKVWMLLQIWKCVVVSSPTPVDKGE
uniref:Uncharacterized protein n=1 Tax=Musca domestica TaxID=7370 RepID=A0A1I8NJ87_MUSDO